nr:3'-5' exonuclease [Anaerolinea sp.]
RERNVEIEVEGRAPFVLDPQQERIVAEPVRPEATPEPAKPPKQAPPVQQELLIKAEEVKVAEEEKKEEALPVIGERLSQNVAIRLVRGFSGSGKTLVIIQRARFLEALYPEWKITVLTFNKPLQEQLESAFRGTSIKPRTFHSICAQYLHPSDEAEVQLDGWLDDNRIDYPVIRQLGKDVVRKEIDWLRDLGVVDREAYLSLDRRGAGRDGRLVAEKREQVFEVLEVYRSYIRENGFWDWHELPLLLLDKLESRAITPDKYDAILIDEAQDWAPIWFKVINHFLEPNHGLLFLADDPSQSIYRHFSWKEKSVHVVGRTRWLRVPYRNTYEIYRAAYAMIAGNEEIQQSLSEAGELIQPEISSQEMRHGPTPLIRKCSSVPDEMEFIKSNIDTLRQDGFRDEQIAVLVRNRGDVDPMKNTLRMRGYEVKVNPIHSFKGLEMEAVILPHLQKTFLNEDNEAAERRLLYVAMSRARERLILTYSGRLPRAYEGLRDGGLADFVL